MGTSYTNKEAYIMTVPDWFTPMFIFAVIDWVIVENVFLIWALYELRKMRKEVEKLSREMRK